MIRKSSFSADGITDFWFRIAPTLAEIQAKCQLLQLLKGQHIASNDFYEMLISKLEAPWRWLYVIQLLDVLNLVPYPSLFCSLRSSGVGGAFTALSPPV